MAAVTAIAVGAVAIGGAVASSMAAKSAAKNAKNAQTDALNSVQYVDTDKVNSDALAADTSRFKNQFDLQEKYDPTVANLRTEGSSKLLDGLKDDPQANALLQQLTSEGAANSPQREAVIKQLMDGAQSELNAGATLPPEFQQELVRSGLESTGSSGTTGSGAAGVQARTLLGSAGIQLQAERRTQAQQLLSTADTLTQNRANILSNAINVAQNVKNQNATRATNAYSIGAAGVPNAGLTGNDIANLDIANLNLKNQVTLGKGGVNANYALAKGAANQQMIGGITSGLTGAIGGVGGGSGGILSMIGGGGGMGGAGSQSNPVGYSTYGRGTYIA